MDLSIIFLIIPLVTANIQLPSATFKSDYRFISYKDLQQSFHKFSRKGVTTYSQLLFDVARNQVIVGARDTLFRLQLSDLNLIENATWTSPYEKIQACLTKGQSEENCHNFIKVLVTNGKNLFICGTNSFSPECTWRELENINSVTNTIDGKAMCPYNPRANTSALMTDSGEYYIGGPTDFAGSDFVIYRGLTSLTVIQTEQYNSLWLNEPQFVASFETDRYIYFLFREAAVEYINCGKVIYSRVARMCKNDSGGKLRRNNWTTFLKARLNCSITGEYPFYFNEIQSASFIAEEGMVYATFSTPANSIAGSAICAFNLTAIDTTFSGPFKYQEHINSTWEKYPSNYQNHFECRGSSDNRDLIGSSKFQLMDNAVQATTMQPLHVAELERYTHITVDVLDTKLHKAVHILYVATTDGFVKKISVLSRTLETCVVEIWQPVQDATVPIISLQYLKDTNSIYVGTESELLKIPSDQCSRHVSKDSCLNAMDPYCGWHDYDEACTIAPQLDPLAKYWFQSATSCPVLDARIDGGWSSWGDWSPCGHLTDSESNSQDECLCRSRQCNNPAPRNSGTECVGLSIQVANCTVHGGWTAWSQWSECSATCGNAIKTRTRTCTNPAPAHGGRVCVGQDRSEILCNGIPPCPVSTPTPQDGGWCTWEKWSACSVSCGRGFRKRMRQCNEPIPAHGGLDCTGTNIEYEECGSRCPEPIEHKRTSSWSQWFSTNNSTTDELWLRRIRYSCKAPVRDPSLIKLSMHKEEKICRGSSCNSEGHEVAKWSVWSPWSPCSATCDKGHQMRVRHCEGPGQCRGRSTEKKICVNSQRCSSQWSCWTDWSICSVTCGWGIKTRHRSCLGSSCTGHSQEHEPCEQQPCNSLLGWSNWTSWSDCDENQFQHRIRKCKSVHPNPNVCQGASKESRICLSNYDIENDIPLLASRAEVATGGGYVVGYITIGIMVGVFVTLLVRHGYVIYKRRHNRIPSSPHYINSKPNSYVPVPLKERPKRSTSASQSIVNNLNGTLKLPKMNDYESTSPKRNSHSLNNALTKSDISYYD